MGLITLLGLSCLIAAGAAPSVSLHDFADVSAWTPNPDGGNAPTVSAGAPPVAGLRVHYVDSSPHWGNLTGPCHVPADAVELRVRFYKHAAASGAAMNIWLFEPDGDAWVQQLLVRGKPVGALAPGWHEARLRVGAFTFEPRGARTRQMTAANRMLIGCNYADLEVTMASMAWETAGGGATAPLPRTQSVRAERRPRGSIAVLDLGDGLPDGFASGHPVRKMASALRQGGFGVTMIKAGDLADPAVLSRRNFDVVVMTGGPYFPAAARGAFLAFLRQGGSFLSTDGYAFDRPVTWSGDRWAAAEDGRTAGDMGAELPQAPPMNTRTGAPGDAMTFAPEQIGAFDPQFPLEHVRRIRPGIGWNAPMEAAQRVPKPLTGYAACGLTGDNSPVFPPVYRRWIPVLEAVDDHGGPRGAALALMHNVAGPYKGSSWAFSGVTSGQDLLLGTATRRGRLWRLMDALVQKVYPHDLRSDLACYRSGETASVQVSVSNFGPARRTAVLTVRIGAKQPSRLRVTVEPGKTRTVTMKVPVDASLVSPGQASSLRGAFCPLSVALLDDDGRTADVLDGGFCIWRPEVVAGGPRAVWKDNYLAVDGRPTFLAGTNQTGMMFYSAHEDPAVWDRDFRRMARHNVHVLRILHFSPFGVRGYEGQAQNPPLELPARPPERFCRQMDAIVELAQAHRIVLFLSVHDWQDIVLTDAELQAQARWNRFWADRYKDVPGFLWDVQNEPSVDVPDRPDVVALWNAWLRERYGSDEGLRAAWGTRAPEAALPGVPLPAVSGDWYDVRSADRKRFEAVLLNRWVKANVDGIKAGDPDAIVTVGYLPSMSPADKMLGTHHLDFSNMHYYGSVEGYPLELKLIDRRFAGKGFSVGEFGAQEAHDARTQGRYDVPVDDSVRRFRAVLHYGAAMGAAFVCNWDWKEFDESVFPWGLVQRGDATPKPWLHTYAQGSLFLSFLEPVYRSPELFLLAPDRNRIGPGYERFVGAMHRAIGLLLDQQVDFGVINEEDLDRLPASAKALVWPVPYCPDDATFDRVLQWVRAGGRLYLSGDIQFDAARKPTRAERRTALGLPAAAPRSPLEAPADVEQEAIATAVGQGGALYAPYPLELGNRPTDAAVYRRFVDMAGVQRVAAEPAGAPVRAQSLALRDGGRLTALLRAEGQTGRADLTLPGSRAFVALAAGESALVVTGPGGEVRGLEVPRAARLGGDILATSTGQFGLVALDGLDLRRSRQVLVLPHQEAQVTVGGLAGVRGGFGIVAPLGYPGPAAPLRDAVLRFGPGDVAVLAATRADLNAAVARVRARLALH